MKPRRPRFIVLEGLDGSGKTTLSRLLSEALEATWMTTPMPRVRVFRDDLICSFEGQQEPAHLFYLATVFHAGVRAGTLKRNGASVVLDRYFLSTEAYARSRGSVLRLDGVSDQLQPADLTVYLDVPLEVRRSRLAARGLTESDRETIAPEMDRRLREAHLALSGLPVVGCFLHLEARDEPPEALVARTMAALDHLP